MAGILITLILLVLMAVGVRCIDRAHGGTVGPRKRWLLRALGGTLIVVGVLGIQISVLVFITSLVWVITILILVTTLIRYRAGERRAFMWCLAAAAERGVSLEETCRAFSLERGGYLGKTARHLADLLESGVPLSLAMDQTWFRVPYDLLLGVRLGVATGDLNGAMKKITKLNNEPELLLRSMLEKCVYLIMIAWVLLLMLVFVMLKIVPVFDKMFRDFEIKLPAMTELLVAISWFVVNFWFLAAPLFLLLVFVVFLGTLYYLYLLPRDLPLLSRLTKRWDAALVMRSLALAVHQQRPFESMIQLLSEHYPRASMRWRLRKAQSQMKQAASWTEALRQAGIVRGTDEDVLVAAQRSGNLEWALDEMADSCIRRLTYRLRLALSIVFPALLYGYGCVIAFVVIALFIPLISLIQGLS